MTAIGMCTNKDDYLYRQHVSIFSPYAVRIEVIVPREYQHLLNKGDLPTKQASAKG